MSVKLLLALLVFSLAGCNTTGDLKAVVGLGEPTAPQKTSYEKLPEKYQPSGQAIGDDGDIADHRARGLGLVNIPELEAYLNGLLGQIKRQAGMSDAPGSVFITAGAEPDAQASADGNIYVSFGMLKNIDAEDELIGLLSHEFAHVALGHHDSDVWGNYQKQIQTAYSIAAQLQSNLQAGHGNAQLGKSQSGNLQKLQLIIEMTDRVLHPAWKRMQEEEADRLAIDLSTRLGYSFARGHKSILEKVATLEETVNVERKRSFEERFSAQAKEGKLDLGGTLQYGFDEVLNVVSSTHDAGSKRIAAAVLYHENFYDDKPRPEPKREPWQKVLAKPAVRGVFQNYRLADEATMSLLRNDKPKALRLAKQAVKAPTELHPYTLLALAKIQEANNDQRGFEQTTHEIAKIKEPVWSLYEMRAEHELQRGRNEEAQKIMEDGYERFGGAPTLRPRMIGFYDRINRKDKSNAMALDCSFKSPGYRDECLKAGGFVKNHNKGNGRGRK